MSLRDEFEETFIILDALDECKEREKLLVLLKSLNSLETEKLHGLATSWRERDIEETFESLVTSEIYLQSAVVNIDIHNHLLVCLNNLQNTYITDTYDAGCWRIL